MRIQSLRAGSLYTNVLEVRSEVVFAREVDPKMDAIDLHDALLMLKHEH